ncbi:glycosyl transferase family protein [Aspergillus sclerotioniger CBS 115572]|uniref:Glycosyl transferase family protein n=1 Tax=Aspergillus sclerotioniger CBS 115572 TaxID=1450535 RepID=A0A317W044_9EURO|nr:glycosyl transferase family protein [Aspergillus sclerotioniger CBS 115572]PWY79375.1 glycosyl transferase family protein [Aspergillus sclerotioniger CBS 115572]
MAHNSGVPRITDATRVWTTLITNTAYLSGLLTLEYSLRKVGSKYPLVALYTDAFPAEGHAALDARGILKQRVPYLLPSVPKDYVNDVRFYDCWSKLTAFSLVEYERVVQLDSDMMVLRNMDELMEIELDPPALAGTGNRVFASSHACVCNPLQKPHYPQDWTPSNCAYTSQHAASDVAQTEGASPTIGLGISNGGLLVVNPSKEVYDKIISQLASTATSNYEFADQSLLSDVFFGRWVALPYVYNALKTMRWEGVHDAIWRDESVKNMHYLLSPKPWDESEDIRTGRKARLSRDAPHTWWWEMTEERVKEEKAKGVNDRF